MQIANIPLAVISDSYKASHFLQYPDAKAMSAYGEFRSAFENNKTDQRLVFFGIRYR
jgi:nicotinamide phosphoribosyltransferase